MATVLGQLILDGMAMGLVYVVLAGGLVLMLSVPRIFFIAYGQWYMVGAYVVWGSMTLLKLPFFVALCLAVIATTILGLLTYRFIFRYIPTRLFLANIVAAVGLMLMLGQGGLLVFGTVARGIPSVFPGIVEAGGLSMPVEKLVLVGLGVLIILALFYLYEKTDIGRAMRAISFNPDAAALCGVAASRVYLTVFGVSAALAGFSGGITAPVYVIYPEMGYGVFFIVLLVLMLGGMGSLPGAVLGGLLLGITLSFGQYFMGTLAQILLFAVIAIVVFFRPGGLLGGRGLEI